MLPRLIVANDLPGLGKVALASSLPIMAACQVETAILPTVILSSHTGSFKNIQLDDYTEGLTGFLAQWQSLDISFVGMLTGYLKNDRQIDLLAAFAKDKQLPLFVDPIMGDEGKYYQGFDEIYAQKIKELCQMADVIIPNLTETAFLTGTAYLGEHYDSNQIRQLLRALAELGPKYVVLTGISFKADQIGLACYDVATDEVVYVMGKRYPQHFFGTGDIVTAILAAAYFQGISLEKASHLALDFLDKTMQGTLELQRDLKYGLCYEPYLLGLLKDFQKLLEEKR